MRKGGSFFSIFSEKNVGFLNVFTVVSSLDSGGIIFGAKARHGGEIFLDAGWED